jgi:hypothetical protein
MIKKYLDYDGLVRVSGEIKSRVKSVNSLPATATDGAVYLYVGEDTLDYKKGHTYQYSSLYAFAAGENEFLYFSTTELAEGLQVKKSEGSRDVTGWYIDELGTAPALVVRSALDPSSPDVQYATFNSCARDSSKDEEVWTDVTPPINTFDDEDFSVDAQNEVSLIPARRVYHGTRAAWDLLSVAEKKTYGAAAFTDDEGVIGCIKSKTFSGTSDNNGFLLIDDDFYANKVVVLGVSYPSGTPPYRIIPIVSTNGNKWFLCVGDLLTGESLANITITNATVYYVEI